jgi:hypothetical protein
MSLGREAHRIHGRLADLTSPDPPPIQPPAPPSPDRARSRPAGLASELHLTRKGREETDGELEDEAPARVAFSTVARV